MLGDIFSNHKMVFDVLWHYIIPSLNDLKFEYFSLTVKLKYYAGYVNTPLEFYPIGKISVNS